MKKYNIIFFTLARSGFGYLMRLHNIIKECQKYGQTPLFVCGAQYIPEDIANSDYDKIVLPKMTFNHFTNEFKNIEFIEIYQTLIENLLIKWKPDFFVDTHIHSRIQLLENISKEAWGETKRILLLRDVIYSPEDSFKNGNIHDWIRKLFFFDRIFIAGCQEKFDFVKMYHLPEELNKRIKYLGYVTGTYKYVKIDKEYDIIISFGSGQHRDEHMKFVAKYLIPFFKESKLAVLIIKGKYYQDILENQHQENNRITFSDFMERNLFLSYVSKCKLNVIAGGYNSLIESLTIGINTLVLTRNELSEVVTRNKFLDNSMLDINQKYSTEDLINIFEDAVLEKKQSQLPKIKFDGVSSFFKHLKQND